MEKPMLRTFATILGAIAFGAAAQAADIEQHFAGELVGNAAAVQQLKLEDGATTSDLSSTKLLKADVNGDGASDYILTAYANKSAVVGVWIARKGGTYTAAEFSGFEAIDCNLTPRVRSLDVTGDGAQELHIEATRTFSSGTTVRTLKFVRFDGGNLSTVFSAMLDGSEKNAATFSRSTHMVKVLDVDSDGVNEIQLESRRVELLETQRGQRELERSVQSATLIYKLDGSAYELDSESVSAPSEEDKLAVADELLNAGELRRAQVYAQSVINSADADDAMVASATRLLAQAKGTDGVISSDDGASNQS